jgi:hypothetical protein
MVVLQSWEFPDQWSFGYEIGWLGRSLVEGHGFSFVDTASGEFPSAKFPPVYPLLVAGSFAIFGVYSKAAAIILLLFQSICAAVTGVSLVILGSRFFGRKEGIVAGLIWAFYPSSIFHSVVRIWYSEMSIMLIFLIIMTADSVKRFHLLLRVVCLGALTGFLVITDSTMMVYSALILIWMLYKLKVRLRKWIGLAVIWVIAAGVVTSPWAIRNWLVLGTPSILKSNFGEELFLGNNPYSTGGGIDREREQAMAALNEEEHSYYRNHSEHSYFSYLKKKAFEWIRMHPSRFVQLSAKRFWYFWGKFPSSGPGIWSIYSWFQLVWYIPITLLALYGLWYSIRRQWNPVPVWLFLLVYPLPYYVTHVQLYRYRYPVEPFIVLLTAIPLTVWLGRFLEALTSTRQ